MYVAAATTEAVVTEPAVTEPAVNEPVVTEPATTDALDSTEPAPSEPPVAGVEVDDDPVCQALRRVCAAAVFYAPALAPDVVVIRTGGFTEEELVALAASGDDGIDVLWPEPGSTPSRLSGRSWRRDQARRRRRGVSRRSRDLRRRFGRFGRLGRQRGPGGRSSVPREADHAVSDTRCVARAPVAQQRFGPRPNDTPCPGVCPRSAGTLDARACAAVCSHTPTPPQFAP